LFDGFYVGGLCRINRIYERYRKILPGCDENWGHYSRKDTLICLLVQDLNPDRQINRIYLEMVIYKVEKRSNTSSAKPGA
jgi:hypothetical protein